MENWTRSAKVTYKRWRNPEPGDEGDFVGHTDEDQATDNEICTIASAKVDSGSRESANSSGNNKTAGTFTVDDALEVIGFGVFQWKLSFVTGLAWVGDSMEMMILSILGPELHCDWSLPSYQVALITSVVFIGMGFSSLVWGNVADKYGRKVGLVMSMCWALYYGLLSAFSPVYGWLLALRSFVGFGIGGTPQSVTLYSEFLPVRARGMSIMLMAVFGICFYVVFWVLGTVSEVLLALWVMPTLGWRWLLGLSAIPVGIFVSFCFWLPESPRFDVLSGRREKAIATLTRIARENGKELPQGTLIEYKQNERGQYKDLFSQQYWKITLLLWFIWFSFAFSYFGIVLLTTELFQTESCGMAQGSSIEPRCSLECKYLTSADYKDLLWTTLAEFPGLLIILFAVDYLGRKKSMAICFFMFSLCILPLYACIGRIGQTIFIFIARAFISGGYQVVFVYTPEVFPTEIRALGMGTCSAFARVGALITPFVAQVLLRTSMYLTLSVYCGCSLLAALASIFLPIETLGRSLQESSLDSDR